MRNACCTLHRVFNSPRCEVGCTLLDGGMTGARLYLVYPAVVSDAASGGQLLMDETTFLDIKVGMFMVEFMYPTTRSPMGMSLKACRGICMRCVQQHSPCLLGCLVAALSSLKLELVSSADL